MVTLGVAVYNNHCSHTLKRLITSNAEYYEIYFHKKVLFKKNSIIMEILDHKYLELYSM